MRNEDDRGYALIVALTAVMAFAYVAFQVLAANQGTLATVQARAERARLLAAADAGVMIAIHGLGEGDPAERWTIDGASRRIDFNGVSLTVAVDDERAKAPLAGLNDAQARILFEGAGAAGGGLESMVEEFGSWRRQDSASRPPGASAETAAHHFRSVGELMSLPGMDLALYDRIAPSVTVFFEPGGHFEPEFASPLALAAMQSAPSGPAVTAHGQALLPNLAEPEPTDDRLIGRTLAVHVLARDRSGEEARRMAVVELTGAKAEPYWIRYVE